MLSCDDQQINRYQSSADHWLIWKPWILNNLGPIHWYSENSYRSASGYRECLVTRRSVIRNHTKPFTAQNNCWANWSITGVPVPVSVEYHPSFRNNPPYTMKDVFGYSFGKQSLWQRRTTPLDESGNWLWQKPCHVWVNDLILCILKEDGFKTKLPWNETILVNYWGRMLTFYIHSPSRPILLSSNRTTRATEYCP